MSGTGCHACLTGVKTLVLGVGSAGEPLGCCRRCHALACGYHAHRDAGIPEYICVECDPNLLAASAGAGAPPDNPLRDELVSYYFPPEYGSFLQSSRPFRSLEDFLERRPGYGGQWVGKVRNLVLDPWKANDTRMRAVVELPQRSKELLMAAAAISQLYHIQARPKLIDELDILLPPGWSW